MEDTVKERLMRFIKHLGIGQRKFEMSVGLSNGYINSLKRSPSAEKVQMIIGQYPELNIDWLLSGEGDMLKSAPPEPNASLLGRAVSASGDDTVKVRFFEVSPTASFIEFCSGMSEDPDFVTIIPNLGETIDDTYCVFSVYGDSMEPQIQHRARVLCREISPSRWHTLHDCVIVIAYADRFVIKRLSKNRLEAENYLTLSSDNPDYPNIETVPLSEIRTIFKALRIISQQIS